MSPSRPVKERDFLHWIISAAQRHGWLVKHVPAPMVASGNTWRPYRKAAGLPDLFMLHADPPRLIIAEVKGSGGKLTKSQQEFLTMARDVAESSFAPGELEREQSLLEMPRTVGVYVFLPGMEEAIEQLLRTRVLT